MSELSEFYDETNKLGPVEAAAACAAELEWIKAELRGIDAKRARLLRSDKAAARELHEQSMRLQRHMQRVRTMRQHAEEMVEKKERHRLWCAAVTEVCGADKLNEVIRWMTNEKRRARGLEQFPAPDPRDEALTKLMAESQAMGVYN